MANSQELLGEIEKLRTKFFQGSEERRKELEREISTQRRGEIFEESKKEQEKLEWEIKELILRDLSSWALCPEGFLYRVDGKLIEPKNIGYYYGTSIMFQGNNKKEIVNGFIEEIKQNPPRLRY